MQALQSPESIELGGIGIDEYGADKAVLKREADHRHQLACDVAQQRRLAIDVMAPIAALVRGLLLYRDCKARHGVRTDNGLGDGAGAAVGGPVGAAICMRAASS